MNDTKSIQKTFTELNLKIRNAEIFENFLIHFITIFIMISQKIHNFFVFSSNWNFIKKKLFSDNIVKSC
jgi:hypothetical protein